MKSVRNLDYKCKDYENAEQDIFLLFDNSQITVERYKRKGLMLKHSEECKRCKNKINDVMESLALFEGLFGVDEDE